MKEQVLAVQRMQDYIEKNKAEEISLSDLARASLFSPWYSYRLFRDCLSLHRPSTSVNTGSHRRQNSYAAEMSK